MLRKYMRQQRKEGNQFRQIWQPLCCHVTKSPSVILLRASTKCKIQILPSKHRNHHKCNCWKNQDCDIQQKNSINPYVHADTIRYLLIYGHGKLRNVMTTSFCGKTLILKSLKIISNAFSTPANVKYAQVGVDNVDVTLLQDFRWSCGLIS